LQPQNDWQDALSNAQIIASPCLRHPLSTRASRPGQRISTAGDQFSSVLRLFFTGQTQDLIFYLKFLSLYVREFLVAHGWMGQGFLEPLLEDAVLLGKLVQMT
jgi:hypothetical protein